MTTLEIIFSLSSLASLLYLLFNIYFSREKNNKLTSIGHEFKNFDLVTLNRIELKSRLLELSSDFSEFDILLTADRYNWPNPILSCLPKLYFKSTFNKKILFIWGEALQFYPKEDEYRILEKLCEGNILKIKFLADSMDYIDIIASKIEDGRLNNTFPSYHALYGIINQEISDIELSFESKNETKLSSEIQKVREEFLRDELKINIDD